MVVSPPFTLQIIMEIGGGMGCCDQIVDNSLGLIRTFGGAKKMEKGQTKLKSVTIRIRLEP